VKRLEHLWKGLSHDRTQISPIPPEAYGDRFIKFMTGITMTKEEAERRGEEEGGGQSSSGAEAGIRAQRHGDAIMSIDGTRSSRDSADPGPRSPAVDKTMQKAYKQADKSEKRRSSKEEPPERTFGTVRSPSAERSHGNAGATLPIVEEAGEVGSTGGRSRRSGNSSQQINEKDGEYSENSKPDVTNTAGRIRHVPSEEEMNTEGYDMSGSFLPDVPKLQPMLSASPPPIDPEKSLGGMMDQQPSPEGTHAR
jgi:1-phosphatidylinositol-4-phosphate 5-kinase